MRKENAENASAFAWCIPKHAQRSARKFSDPQFQLFHSTYNSNACSHFGSSEFRMILLFLRTPPTPTVQNSDMEAELAFGGMISFPSRTIYIPINCIYRARTQVSSKTINVREDLENKKKKLKKNHFTGTGPTHALQPILVTFLEVLP